MPLSPRLDYRTCKRCDRHADECGPLSYTRLCEECGIAVAAENLLGLMNKSGESYQHWARRSFMAARRALVASEQGEG
jgi:hypothetical protein